MSKGLYLGVKDLGVYLGVRRSEVKVFLADCGLITATGKPTAKALRQHPLIVIGKRPKWWAPFVAGCWRRSGREVPDGGMDRVRVAREERRARAASRAPRKEPTLDEVEAMREKLLLRAEEHKAMYPSFRRDMFAEWVQSKPLTWIRWAHGRKISSLNKARRNEEKAMAMAD